MMRKNLIYPFVGLATCVGIGLSGLAQLVTGTGGHAEPSVVLVSAAVGSMIWAMGAARAAKADALRHQLQQSRQINQMQARAQAWVGICQDRRDCSHPRHDLADEAERKAIDAVAELQWARAAYKSEHVGV